MNEIKPTNVSATEETMHKGTNLANRYMRIADGEVEVLEAEYIDSDKTASASDKRGGKMKSAAKVAAGGVCVAAGVPMLILPGPGLLAIGSGVALIANGVKELVQKKG